MGLILTKLDITNILHGFVAVFAMTLENLMLINILTVALVLDNLHSVRLQTFQLKVEVHVRNLKSKILALAFLLANCAQLCVTNSPKTSIFVNLVTLGN